MTQAALTGAADPLAALLQPADYARTVCLDLGRVDFIDSSGVGWLLHSHRRFREAGGQLRLGRVPPRVGEVLRLCGLDNVLDIGAD
jgi:anti-anti-sigma factor